jgi:hypothetical protein
MTRVRIGIVAVIIGALMLLAIPAQSSAVTSDVSHGQLVTRVSTLARLVNRTIREQVAQRKFNKKQDADRKRLNNRINAVQASASQAQAGVTELQGTAQLLTAAAQKNFGDIATALTGLKTGLTDLAAALKTNITALLTKLEWGTAAVYLGPPQENQANRIGFVQTGDIPDDGNFATAHLTTIVQATPADCTTGPADVAACTLYVVGGARSGESDGTGATNPVAYGTAQVVAEKVGGAPLNASPALTTATPIPTKSERNPTKALAAVPIQTLLLGPSSAYVVNVTVYFNDPPRLDANGNIIPEDTPPE